MKGKETRFEKFFGRGKRKSYTPTVVGFVVLYLVLMLLSTYIMRNSLAKTYGEKCQREQQAIQGQIWEKNFLEPETVKDDEAWQAFLESVLFERASAFSSAYAKFTGAVYDEAGALLTKSESMIVGYDTVTGQEAEMLYYRASEYLDDARLEEVAGYMAENLKSMEKMEPAPYRITLRVTRDGRKLAGIVVEELAWERTTADALSLEQYNDSIFQTDGTSYTTVSATQVWQWENPDTGEKASLKEVKWDAGSPFPGLKDGVESWQAWENNEYVQDYQENIGTAEQGYQIPADTVEHGVLTVIFSSYRLLAMPVTVRAGENQMCRIMVNVEADVWREAVHNMKYVYLMGFLLMLVCLIKILYTSQKINRQRAILEGTRRDFTNAMAHELKTPLGIIRGFAENLKENTVEGKKDYYLDQIVGQTEEMDKLVAQMLYVSKLDSTELALSRTKVSFTVLFREEEKKFRPLIEEGNLHIQYAGEEDFQAEGDPAYLRKAIGNLLSNAVAYNIPGGSIRITTDRNRCTVENTTSAPIAPEDLPYLFDMFYSGDKSRSSEEKHMGLGLCLTRKILELHHLNIIIQNTETGVKLTISK